MTKVPVGADTLGRTVMRTVIDQLRSMSVTYSELPEEQQQEFLDTLGSAVQPAIVQAMREALALGWPSVIAKLSRADITEDGVKLHMSFPPTELHAITDYVGSDVVLVLVNPMEHAEGVKSFQADLDQPELRFGVAVESDLPAPPEMMP